MIHFHKGATAGWYYISFGKWQPFAYFNHGGWVYLTPRWFIQHGTREFVRRRRVRAERSGG